MNFNKQQLEAINHVNGNIAVISGAGSGKSTVLVNRIKNMVEIHNINERDILAISFTNKAAEELKHKLNKLGLKNVNTGTFHSVCARILMENNINVSKLIADWQVESCLKNMDSKIDVDDVKSFIGYQKNYGKTYKDQFIYKESKYSEDELRYFFKGYETYKSKQDMYDFDDWMLECLKLLKQKPYAYDYVLIDEFQDTSVVQNMILKELCKSNNMFTVFDFKQAIYGWRGANPEYCMNFHKDWDNAKVLNLFVNYRSRKNIVEKANGFIRPYYTNYEHYMDAESHNQEDGDIELLTSFDRAEESIKVVDKIEEMIKSGIDYEDIAVLYRLNSHSEYIECELKNRKIPYDIANNSSFFKRKEIDGVMSFLRLIENPHDDMAFETIFKLRTYPLSFFSNAIFDEIRKNAAKYDYSLYESFLNKRYEKTWQTKNVAIFEDNINRLRLQKDKGIKIERLIDNVLKLFNFDEFLENKYTNSEELEDRKKSFNVLKSFIKGDSLTKFIEYVYSNSSNNKTRKKKNIEGIKLMSVHASKGLEFDNVFVVGIEDTKFPHSKSPLEEESRLFYVAITRPKENLYISQIGYDNKFVNEYFGLNFE